MRLKPLIGFVSAAALVLGGCGGGSSNPTAAAVSPPPPPTPTAVYTVPAQEALSIGDVQDILARAAAEAKARNLPATIAVTDRVGNVLAVFQMVGALQRLFVPRAPDPATPDNDLQGFDLINGAPLGSISKALTAAYLSSGGNAFSTRTASQIIQEHFPPAPNAVGLESGPLSGVQFSQLPCSDVNTRDGMIGPKRSPLGLSADPGGLPLYKNGVLVGAIGVMADGQYGFDPNILNIDQEDEEFIALAGTIGFEAPVDIQADRVTVDGTALRFSDADRSGLKASGTTPAFTTLVPGTGSLIGVRTYITGPVVPGTPYGTEASGIRAARATEFANPDAFVLTDGAGNPRFPLRAGTDGAEVAQPLSASEARSLLEEAFKIMSRARGQIRRPLDSRAQVSISLVDTYGAILGLVRAPDAPIFGIDVSAQKARTAAFFSNARAAQELDNTASPDVVGFMTAARTFFADPTVFTGQTAWSNRAIGNIHRPYFPDGEVGRPNGPFSRSIKQFNPFSTGLQSTMISANVLGHVLFVLRRNATDTPQFCTQTPRLPAGGTNRLANGIQIFPGSVPIYRGSTLVGAIGVSGDGIDQDDMISFLGAVNGGARAGGLTAGDPAKRSDQIVVKLADGAQVRLRYVNCPFAPFLDTAEQNVCQGR